ncbi:iron-sulfur cluster co-chaperone protein HscB-like protein, mitochondrial [Musca autumnalis]|uniref:iron-sulfur cluster co-chaperone protein HscB-like protein, mitochondrial n=1 Tax=Musca autumnalis TaxID=221902 RepID=UPI003CF6EC28
MRRVARICFTHVKRINDGRLTSSRHLGSTTSLRTLPRLQLDWEQLTSSSSSVSNQQKRGYVPDNNVATANQCWNCKKDTVDKMLCQHCNHLQDVDAEVNYFELMEFPQTFSLEAPLLTKRFRQLQSLVHPDKFSNKSSREQSNSADWSSLINKAYKTLLVPIERGQYLLKLHGRQIPQDNSALNKEFLMEMMERNEEVDDAETKQELEDIHERLAQELEEKITDLSKHFADKNLEGATALMVEMKYLLSIQNTIKNKLQSLMGS